MNPIDFGRQIGPSSKKISNTTEQPHTVQQLINRARIVAQKPNRWQQITQLVKSVPSEYGMPAGLGNAVRIRSLRHPGRQIFTYHSFCMGRELQIRLDISANIFICNFSDTLFATGVVNDMERFLVENQASLFIITRLSKRNFLYCGNKTKKHEWFQQPAHDLGSLCLKRFLQSW